MASTLYASEYKKEALDKKLYNIDSFSKLDRSGLQFQKLERRILLQTFSSGEKLYIQFPGKETIRPKNPRPWDFRPKLQFKDGTWLKDLSFKDVWDDLYALHDIDTDLSYVATLYFRMAYMIDSKLTTEQLEYEDVDESGNIVKTGKIDFSYYKYIPTNETLNDFQASPNSLRGCSVYAYLMYNDLLAQNEDCKYYYRSIYEKGEKWNGSTGRRNTLLTHMSVIAFIKDYLRFTEITDAFQRGLGVAPLQPKLWNQVTGGRIDK